MAIYKQIKASHRNSSPAHETTGAEPTPPAKLPSGQHAPPSTPEPAPQPQP
jgi:hypothetical protein